MPVPSHESEQSCTCICFLRVWFLDKSLNCSDWCFLFFFFINISGFFFIKVEKPFCKWNVSQHDPILDLLKTLEYYSKSEFLNVSWPKTRTFIATPVFFHVPIYLFLIQWKYFTQWYFLYFILEIPGCKCQYALFCWQFMIKVQDNYYVMQLHF